MPRLRASALVLAAAALLATTACSRAEPAPSAPAETAAGGTAQEVRLGYFPNVTHAPALVGVQGGIFKKALGSNVDLQSKTFNSGTEELTAIQAGALDAAYIGPNPTITAWTQLDKGVKVARARDAFTSGGRSFSTGSALVDTSTLGSVDMAALAAKRQTPVTGLDGYPVDHFPMVKPKIGVYSQATSVPNSPLEKNVAAPSPGRHDAWLTQQIRRVHAGNYGVYGARKYGWR